MSSPWEMEFFPTEEEQALLVDSEHLPYSQPSESLKGGLQGEIPPFKRAVSYVGTQSGFKLWDPTGADGPDIPLDSSTPPPLSAQYTFLFDSDDAPLARSSLISPQSFQYQKAADPDIDLFPVDTAVDAVEKQRPRSSPLPIPVSPSRAKSSSFSSSSFASLYDSDDESSSVPHTLPDSNSLYNSPSFGTPSMSSGVGSPIYRSRPGSRPGSLTFDINPLHPSSSLASSSHLSGTFSSLHLRSTSADFDMHTPGHFSAPSSTGLLDLDSHYAGSSSSQSAQHKLSPRRGSTGSCRSRRLNVPYPGRPSLRKEGDTRMDDDEAGPSQEVAPKQQQTEQKKHQHPKQEHTPQSTQSTQPKAQRGRSGTISSRGSSDEDEDDDDVVTCGEYTRAERRLKIQRYRAKRERRTFKKQIMYECRKTFADKRPRVGGRFVKVDQIATKSRPSKSKSTKSKGK